MHTPSYILTYTFTERCDGLLFIYGELEIEKLELHHTIAVRTYSRGADEHGQGGFKAVFPT